MTWLWVTWPLSSAAAGAATTYWAARTCRCGELLQILADCAGLPRPRRQIPGRLALTAGIASDLVEGRLLRREPRVPLEAARMSATRMIFTDERARAELGYTSRPASEAIEESARWFVDHGYVPAAAPRSDGRTNAHQWRRWRSAAALSAAMCRHCCSPATAMGHRCGSFRAGFRGYVPVLPVCQPSVPRQPHH